MPQLMDNFSRSFARVYETLYSDPDFRRAQIDFLVSIFESTPGPLLDLGCGPGAHLTALVAAGYEVVGVDIDAAMLQVARCKLATTRLVRADMRKLPFARPSQGIFTGALCLESPLAYLLDDADLLTALKSIHGVLRPGGRLIVDVFDYPGTLGTRRLPIADSHFVSDHLRVNVQESHYYEKRRQIWTMRQRFEVMEADETDHYEVMHRLRVRTMDEYTKALEQSGFSVLRTLTAYPETPKALTAEQRIILVARSVCSERKRSQAQ